MKRKKIRALGVPGGSALDLAVEAIRTATKGGVHQAAIKRSIKNIVDDPNAYQEDAIYGALANTLIDRDDKPIRFEPRTEPAPYQKWGTDLEPGAVQQMENACSLPVSYRGALMPDAHQGYGLPIGGVLAVEQAVIPYAVGMDIGCRMKLSVLDWPVSALNAKRDQLIRALETQTRFGIGANFRQRRQHAVMDRDWKGSPITARKKDHAWAQLGTSGSGNHFVEFGTLTLPKPVLDLDQGVYLALLSHSGARGTGAEVAKYYSHLAMDLHAELPKQLKHLAWLDLRSEAGQEYWFAMELMGLYSAANHELIHRHVLNHLGAEAVTQVENHHNFAWKERHFDRDVVVHRKGATPASPQTLGVIPGSMGTPGYVVRGKGNPDSLQSAAHGAGRRMSRKAAKSKYSWADAKRLLQERQVHIISAGLDEIPMAYKNIDEVMAAQDDLVESLARFDPRLVKMAPAGERPED